MKHANAARSALHAFAHNMYRRNEKVLKKKVLKQNNLLRLQKRLAVMMLALTLGLGTGCGKSDDGADSAVSSEAEALTDAQTEDQTDAGASEENGQKSNNEELEENRQESKKDNDEPYVEGTYSSDAYDVAEFTAEPRKKTDEEGNRGVYYEIFVRSFADSDGDGIGDLNGVTEKLDYLPGDGGMKLQFFHVKDLCILMERIIEEKPEAHIMNVGNVEPVTIKDWVTMCYGCFDKIPEFVNVSEDIEQRNYFSFHNYEYYLDVQQQNKIYPETIPLEAGLKECAEWYVENESEVGKKPYMEYIDCNLK